MRALTGACRGGSGDPLAETPQPELAGRLSQHYKEPKTHNADGRGESNKMQGMLAILPEFLVPNRTRSCLGLLSTDTKDREDSATLLPFCIWGFYEHSEKCKNNETIKQVSVFPGFSTW